MIRYFDIENVALIHEKVLKKSGGLLGFKDEGGISQVCDFVQNDLYYPTFLVYLKIIFSMMETKELH